MKPVIEISNLGKKYALTHEKARYDTLRDTIMDFAAHPFRKIKELETFWALKNLDLSINQGEIVGIIGKNGAGKSTLLKILSGITKPTEGRVALHGRVSSLLEVGTGFHPELTGRENIFLNGVILGMSRKEVARKFDQIVDFAGVKQFLDTPVKHYSSGMYVRLAFAVAAHLEPDILIVDEVLAVGDAEFQNRCLGKMEEISKTAGRTILFVSHSMSTIQSLCDKTILLANGKLSYVGPTEDTISFYLSQTKNEVIYKKEWSEKHPGNECIRFDSIVLFNKDKDNENVFAEEPLNIKIAYEILRPIKNLQIALRIKHGMQIIFESADMHLPEENQKTRDVGKYSDTCVIPANLLNASTYFVTMFAHIPNQTMIVFEEDVLAFSIKTRIRWSGTEYQPGLLRPALEWTIDKLAKS